MSDPYVGEIRMFAGNFAPRGWAFCDGQLIAISQNDALFSLLGTIYGGDGRTTFGLPDMRGRLPLHAGHGPGLSLRKLGSRGGAEQVTLTVNQIPSHTHDLSVNKTEADSLEAYSQVLAARAGFGLYSKDPADVSMSSSAITSIGGSRSHTNLMPTLCVNFIIALVGIYPSRS